MPARDSDRVLRARLAAHTKWAKTEDPSHATAPAREAFAARFEREVDPDGVLPPADRARRAEHAKKAFFTRLALKSAQARRARSNADALDAEVSAEMEALGGDAA